MAEALKKLALFCISAVALFVGYFGTKLLAPVGVPVGIWLDAYIPFAPAFIVPYLLFFPLLLVPWFLLWKNYREYKALAIGFILVSVVSAVIFVAYQTTGPRIGLQVTDWATWLVSQIYSGDVNLNAFPSLHTAFSALIAAFVWKNYKGKWIGYGSLALAILIVMSTVLIKQHGIVDVLGGLALAGFAYWAGRKVANNLWE